MRSRIVALLTILTILPWTAGCAHRERTETASLQDSVAKLIADELRARVPKAEALKVSVAAPRPGTSGAREAEVSISYAESMDAGERVVTELTATAVLEASSDGSWTVTRVETRHQRLDFQRGLVIEASARK